MDLGPWLISHGITVVSTVPTLAALWPVESLESVRLLIFGGEACPPELAERLAVEGREVWNTYGPTEATVVACAAPLGGPGPIRIGLPLDGWDLAVVDADSRPVEEGEVGELIIGGVGLARYLDPAKDAEKYAPMPSLGWTRAYRSGDLVRYEAAGLIFQGRADEQVKLGGRRIELGEIDAALQSLPDVAGAAAAVQTTAAGNQILVGYLAPAGGQDIDLAAARELLGESLPAPLIPLLTVVDSLPTKTSGKVDRHALPWPLAGAGAADTEAAPLNLPDDAAWIVEQWSAVLGSTVSGLDADFFAYGGGSLAAAQLVSALRVRYPTITVADIYATPRVGRPHRRRAPVAARGRGGPGPGTHGPAHGPQVAGLPDPDGRSAAHPRGHALADVPDGGEQCALLLRRVHGCAHGVLVVGGRLLAGVRQSCGPDARFPSPPPASCSAKWCRGRTPRSGRVHLRLWLAEQIQDLAGAISLASAPWVPYYARALGAKIGNDVQLHSLPPVTGLLSLGSGCNVEPEVDLSGWWIDGDIVHIGAIHVGPGATVGARSTLMPGRHDRRRSQGGAGLGRAGQSEVRATCRRVPGRAPGQGQTLLAGHSPGPPADGPALVRRLRRRVSRPGPDPVCLRRRRGTGGLRLHPGQGIAGRRAAAAAAVPPAGRPGLVPVQPGADTPDHPAPRRGPGRRLLPGAQQDRLAGLGDRTGPGPGPRPALPHLRQPLHAGLAAPARGQDRQERGGLNRPADPQDDHRRGRRLPGRRHDGGLLRARRRLVADRPRQDRQSAPSWATPA